MSIFEKRGYLYGHKRGLITPQLSDIVLVSSGKVHAGKYRDAYIGEPNERMGFQFYIDLYFMLHLLTMDLKSSETNKGKKSLIHLYIVLTCSENSYET